MKNLVTLSLGRHLFVIMDVIFNVLNFTYIQFVRIGTQIEHNYKMHEKLRNLATLPQ